MKKISYLSAICLLLLFAGCSKNKPAEDARVYTQSSGPTLDENTVDLLTTAQNIHHSFSDGTELDLFIIGDHAFVAGADVALSLQAELPDLISEYETSLSGLTTQGIGYVPGALSIHKTPSLWPSGKEINTIYYTLDSFPSNLRPYVDQAIAEWNATSVAIKWKPNSLNRGGYKSASIKWSSGSLTVVEPILRGLGCSAAPAYSSGIGYQDNRTNFPVGGTIYMNSTCAAAYASNPTRFKRTIKHEMGHIIGLWHEMMRCDRDNYIKVTSSKAPSSIDFPYYFNFGKRCEPNIKQYGPYDFNAIMHYGFDFYPTLSTTTTVSQRGTLPYLSYCGEPGNVTKGTNLSAGDIYAINAMYGKGTSSTICAVNAYPKTATVKSGTSISIAAAVSGYNLTSTDKALSWTISPTTGSGSLTARISDYSYLAPRVTSRKVVTLTATSRKAPSKKVSIVLTIVP